MRRIAAAAVIGLCSCLSHGLGPGVLNPHFMEPSRDPDPTRDPTKQQATNVWDETAATPTPDSPKVELAKRTLATFAAVLAAGWMPAIFLFGVFEEVPDARRHR